MIIMIFVMKIHDDYHGTDNHSDNHLLMTLMYQDITMKKKMVMSTRIFSTMVIKVITVMA